MTILYDKDGIILHCGSCVDIMPTIDSVDHVVTDPPFEAKAHAFGMHRDENGKVANAPLPFAPITRELRALCGRQFARLARGWAIVFCQVEAVDAWRKSLAVDNILSYACTCVWTKPDAAPNFSGDCPGHGYESIVACYAGDLPKLNAGFGGGVFSFNTRESESEKIHTTQKPQRLMRHLISVFTKPGDLVLDPFAGSASTALACKILNRRCITIEKDPEFAERARARLERMDQQGDMFAAEEKNG